MPIAGYTFASGQNVATVVVSTSDLQGTAGKTIDSFATTAQTASASFPSSTTGVSYATTSDAVGGARDMYVQLQFDARRRVARRRFDHPRRPVDFTTGPGAIGLAQIIWQGQSAGRSRHADQPDGAESSRPDRGGADTGIELSFGADHAATAALTIYTDANDWFDGHRHDRRGAATARPRKRSSCRFPPSPGERIQRRATVSNVGAIQLPSPARPPQTRKSSASSPPGRPC